MPASRSLFGKKIVPHHLLNYAEQVYDILVGEIELGRWKVNERLPGVIHLAKELKFGTKTIQTAYDRLKQEGYVRSLGYRGTYLKSAHPRSKKVSGKIGVLVSADQTGDPLILWYEHVIMLGGRRKNLVTVVKVIPQSMDIRQANRRGALFDDQIAGIISLAPFRLDHRYGDADGDLPIVFLCPPFENCAPKICADVREAYYELTARVIRAGHTRILFSEDSVEPDPRQTEMHREGYLEAMRDHGLPVDTKMIAASRSVTNSQLPTVSAHLQDILAKDINRRPTAIVSGSLGRSMALVRIAPLHHIDIPRDLSVVSIGSAHIEGSAGRQITGMLPDFDHMVDTCLAMLERQQQVGRSDFTSAHVRMHFVPGDTLRNLSGHGASSAPPHKLNHDIGTLSRAVEFRGAE